MGITDNIPYYKLVRNAVDGSGPEDIPIFGDVYRAGNAIVDFWEYGCFPDWEVWVETAVEPIGELVIALFTFGLSDVLRGYFRPTNIRGVAGFNRLKPPPGRTRPARTGALSRHLRIPETGNMIGKKLPGARFFQGKQTGKYAQRFWKIDGVAQRGLWYWMLADIGADFTVHWTSAIMNSSACNPAGDTTCYNYRSAQGPYVMDDWWPWDVVNPMVSSPEGCIVGTGVTAPPGGGSIAAGCRWVPYLGPFGGGSLRIVNTTTGATESETTTDGPQTGEAAETTVYTKTKGGQRYDIQYKVPPGTFAANQDAWSSVTQN